MCTSLRIYKDSYGRPVYGPCNTCIECRNLRREDFKQRLRFELMDYSYVGSFVSLTYRDDDLPILLPEGSAVVGSWFGSCPPAYGSTLYRPDISSFCDKMQKRLKENMVFQVNILLSVNMVMMDIVHTFILYMSVFLLIQEN